MRIWIETLVPGLALALALGATAARGQGVPDHMQCYRVTSATLRNLKGIVDLDAPSTGLAPGCKLGKPKLYCVPAKQTLHPGTLRDGNTPISPIPYNGPPAETDRICYRVTCPQPGGLAADQTVTDEFGTHEFRKLSTEMVCKPATGGTLPPPRSGFQIRTPEIEIPAYAKIAQCYYLRTPNSATVPVTRWVSEMQSPTRQIVLLTTTTEDGVPLDKYPPGTLSTVDCEPFLWKGVSSQWIYAADTPSAEMALPADDGAGNPVAMEIPPNSAAYILMYNVNPSDQPVKTQVTINAEALDGPIYTKTATFNTYDGSIAIPPMTDGYVRTHSCDVPSGAKFWRLTSHTHGRANFSAIYDGADIAFRTFDWEHPGAATFAPPFFTFASNQLTYGCVYDNPSNYTVRTGNSYQSEEQCVAVGYFFPATKPVRCYEGYILP